MSSMYDPQSVIEQIHAWVRTVVMGLNLCPFAAAPMDAGRVRVVCSRANELGELMAELLHEIDLLNAEDRESDTTLLAAPILLRDFDAFLDAVAVAQALLTERGMDGRYQLAHFHPDYRFADSPPADPAHLTNRAPHPVLHILRWTDVRGAMETHENVADIPRRNQDLLRSMGTRAVHALDLPLALTPFKCWDRATQAIFEAKGEALEDCILQNRAELEEFAQFIEDHNIRSYLEIGVWTGRLVTALHQIFRFDTTAACDQGWAEQCGFQIGLPEDVQFFRGDSASPAYLDWRAELGPIDLVLIDGDHRYEGVKRDFEINQSFPHRYLAFHDITGANRWTTGVRRLWNELEGKKREIIHPHREAGIDTPTMGIGIWSLTEDPS